MDVTGNSNELHNDPAATIQSTTNIDRTDTFDDNVLSGGPKHALHFPGQDNCYVLIPASATLNDFRELTVEVWVKPDANLPNGTYTIINQENAFWIGLKVYTVRRIKRATFYYIINTLSLNGGGTKVKAQQAELGEWQNVALAGNIFDSDNDGTADEVYHTFVKDGELELDLNVISDSEVLDPNAHNLSIGGTPKPKPGCKPFQGLISEVRIWRKDLSLGINPDGSGDTVLEYDDYRWTELPYKPEFDPSASGLLQAVQALSCQSPDLMAYYKFDHGIPGGDNTQPQKVNWLRDHSLNRNHGRLSTGFALIGDTSNWVEADITDPNGKTFKVSSTYGNSDIPPEPGLLLQAPKLYNAETHPLQSMQKTIKAFENDQWEEFVGLYLLVNVKPKDVLVITLNGRRLMNTEVDAGVALGIAIEGDIDYRSGIYYERGAISNNEEALGGMSIQHVYVVPEGVQGLFEIHGVFASYGGGEAQIKQGGKSTLHVMSYSQRPDPNL